MNAPCWTMAGHKRLIKNNKTRKMGTASQYQTCLYAIQIFRLVCQYCEMWQIIVNWNKPALPHSTRGIYRQWNTSAEGGRPFLHNVFALSPERSFTNSPPMVIHTERSTFTELPCNSHRKPVLWLLKRRDGTRHVYVVGVSQVFPPICDSL